MLYLIFHAGQDRFAIESTRVVEVLPMLAWRPVSGATGVVGLVNYHHAALPLVDFTMLITGVPSVLYMSTRILIVRLENDELLAVLVERASGTLRAEPAQFVAPPPVTETAPYLGAVYTDSSGVVQRVVVEHLVSAEGRAYVTSHAGVVESTEAVQ